MAPLTDCGKNKSGKMMSTEENYEQLTTVQRLKAAVHHTTMKICRACASENDVEISQLVVATISEATWKKFEEFSTDLEFFAKHAKRTTINADDVKMLARKNPKLVDFLNAELAEFTASKEPKKKKKSKSKSSETAASSTVADNEEED